MERYIFILGRDPELSEKELITYLSSRSIKFNIIDRSEIVLVIDCKDLKTKRLIKDLGGIQKIAKVIKSFDNLYNGKENKIRYAISNYTFENEEEIKSELKSYFRLEKLKATIKKSHYQQPWLNPSEAKDVLEIILYQDYTAKTLATYDSKEFKSRDNDRPVNTPNKTSIRLAKILLNLSGAKPGSSILVPYCGIGTILGEGLLLGCKMFGIDKDLQDVKASKKNLDWLRKRYNTQAPYKITQGKINDISKITRKADHAVCEPYMGPLLRSSPTEGESKKYLKNLSPFYEILILELGKVVQKSAVITAPRFIAKSKKEFTLKLEPIFQKAGFKKIESIAYRSSKSKMARDIWILKK
tara:strand:- start:2547 stop:3614 length:1068 start_codon:yes stop_codon:yes gene_type:complete